MSDKDQKFYIVMSEYDEELLLTLEEAIHEATVLTQKAPDESFGVWCFVKRVKAVVPAIVEVLDV